MKSVLPVVILFLLFACQSNKQEAESEGDSTVADTQLFAAEQPTLPREPVVPVRHEDNWSIDQKHERWVGDSLVTVLKRERDIDGEIFDVSVVSDHFLNAADPMHARDLIAILIQSGDGTYEGSREWPGGVPIPFQSVYSILAVYEDTPDGFLLIANADLETASSSGLVASSLDAEKVQLRNNQYAALVHLRSSEEGAGDSGFTRDIAYLYVLLDFHLISTMEFPIMDEGFSSDEVSRGSSYSTTTEFTILETSTKGLLDIRLVSTSTSSMESDASEMGDSMAAQGYYDSNDNSDMIFKWSGTAYSCAEGCR